jgi:hypothetical protein
VNNVRCPKCGVEYPENSDRCQNCGNPINENPEKTIHPGNNIWKGNELKKSYFSTKLLGLIGVIFFFPLAVASGIYLITRKEKNAKYWGLVFIIVGGIFWVAGIIIIYTMGYDKFMATYNITNYSNNLTNFGFNL